MALNRHPSSGASLELLYEALSIFREKVPNVVSWAVDGSLSLTLQGLNVAPHDIDILTDVDGAYRIQESLMDFAVKPLGHSKSEKYDSHFGVFHIKGVRVDVMGDLRVFRNGSWGPVQNPHTVEVIMVEFQGAMIPVVSKGNQERTGYLHERMRRS